MIDVCDFQVIGELKANPHHLLLMGDDGQCYAYDLMSGEIAPLQPDDSWAVDVTQPATLRVVVPEQRIAS
jgi:hypothetical protein